MLKAFMYPIVLCRPFANKRFNALIEAGSIVAWIIAWEVFQWRTDAADKATAIGI
jgi:hypothetical protein